MQCKLLFLFVLISLQSFAQETSQEDSPIIAKQKRENALVKRKSVYNFTLFDIEGNEVNLKSFQGKYLYIDFWHAKCRGCILQFPKTNELPAKVKEENIVFISISFDQSLEQWKESLERFEVAGEHLWIGDKEKQAQFIKEYYASFFPKHWWVNPDGNIVHPSTGPPSYFVEHQEDFLGLM